MMDTSKLESLGEFYGYKLYRNSEGLIEGYKGKGKKFSKDKETGVRTVIKAASDLERIVSNATDPEGFFDFIKKKKKREKRYDPYKDEKQSALFDTNPDNFQPSNGKTVNIGGNVYEKYVKEEDKVETKKPVAKKPRKKKEVSNGNS